MINKFGNAPKLEIELLEKKYDINLHWDDSYNFDSSTDDENTYLIFNDFKELLDKIN